MVLYGGHMRRKGKRAFRYFFPIVIITTFIVLYNNTSSTSVVHNAPQEAVVSASGDSCAKMLNFSSHNPETNGKLLINAKGAVKDDGILILDNPNGVFENSKGAAILASPKASYCENDSRVCFTDKVNFNHHSGLEALSSHAVLNTKTQYISGENIQAHHQNNTITAQSYDINPVSDVIAFKGDVCLNIRQKK
jgi:hypothetical protein